jgi:hypothetical protein
MPQKFTLTHALFLTRMNLAGGLSCVSLINIGGQLRQYSTCGNFFQHILNVEVVMGAKFAACSMSDLTSMSKTHGCSMSDLTSMSKARRC